MFSAMRTSAGGATFDDYLAHVAKNGEAWEFFTKLGNVVGRAKFEPSVGEGHRNEVSLRDGEVRIMKTPSRKE